MEALGGAASVIGVVSLAIQVCEDLEKIQDFWQSVKEAPDDVSRISTEIKLFITWLTIIANNYQRLGFNHGGPNEVAATDTLKTCLATVHDMSDEVKDLDSRFSKGPLSKRWASVGFVFRKDKMEKLMQQVERMKLLLIIVQTCYVSEMQEAGFKSLSLSLRPENPALQATNHGQYLDVSLSTSADEGLASETRLLKPVLTSPVDMMSFNPTATPQTPRRPKQHTMQQGRAYNFGVAMLRIVTTKQESVLVEESGNERRTSARRIRYDIRIAQWLLSRGFLWESFGIYGRSWQHNFRTFRYIPSDSLIIDFCKDGDVANVQRMFDKGLASPFDRVAFEDEDWSLLHFSVSNRHPQLCKFLIECGLGHGSVSGMSRDPILSLPGEDIQWAESNPAAHLDTIRIMINEGKYDPMEGANSPSVMHFFNGSPTVYQWLLDQEEFLIDYEERWHDSATNAASLLALDQSHASECLEQAIAHGSGLSDTGSLSGITLAHRAAYHMYLLADNSDFPKRIKVLFDAGVDFHTPLCNGDLGTPLFTLFWVVFEDYENSGFYPTLPLMDIIVHDRLEDTSAIKHRLRTSKSLWRTWYPGSELPLLEKAQRYLDAWMEILLEAGLDIVKYGRREEQLHPEGILIAYQGEARIFFEYGDHVSGCRIHVTEIWLYNPDEDRIHDLDSEEEATSAQNSTMPGGWDFEQE